MFSSLMNFVHALCLFKALRLFFLIKFPGPTFIPCPMSVPDSRVRGGLPVNCGYNLNILALVRMGPAISRENKVNLNKVEVLKSCVSMQAFEFFPYNFSISISITAQEASNVNYCKRSQ